ncbi:MAG: poly-gamma-glutamate synthase PgsB [Candidatus Lernaella stagnicola]|nr:poly-gamma-glutamate synthase PgsB [Candidatus Lernaella stagnicola]
MTAFEVLSAITGGFLSLGILERFSHYRWLSRIPKRIHVAGTRGKSSVTRLLAAGLREAGTITAAKTTGTLARMILPDGEEIPVFRPSGPNIIEQKRIIAAAAEMGCEALVIECMALQPELHWISENKLVRATHAVITNCRADHLDVMGPTEADVARTLAGILPAGGVAFTAEQRHYDILEMAARDRGTELIATTRQDVAAVTQAELDRFLYTEHAENVALCLKVLEHFGVDRDTAMRGMWKAQPDPGAMSVYVVDFFGRQIYFANGFAANDPESTERVWNMARARHPDLDRVIAVFNMRADRPSRTAQMVQDATFWHDADSVLLMGTGAYHFASLASKRNIGPRRFVFVDQMGVDEVFESIVEVCGRSALVIGMGNIGGPGLPLVRYFKNRAVLGGAA